MPGLFTGITIWSLVLLIVGLIFLAAELFQPGFGVFGVLGVIALGLDILISAKTLGQGLLLCAAAAVIVLVVLLVLARLISSGKLPKRLVLRAENGAAEGFSAAESHAALVGKSGEALTVLRPAGIALLDGQRVDVVTRGEFVEQGAPVRVVETEGGRVVVAPIEERS